MYIMKKILFLLALIIGLFSTCYASEATFKIKKVAVVDKNNTISKCGLFSYCKNNTEYLELNHTGFEEISIKNKPAIVEKRRKDDFASNEYFYIVSFIEKKNKKEPFASRYMIKVNDEFNFLTLIKLTDSGDFEIWQGKAVEGYKEKI